MEPLPARRRSCVQAIPLCLLAALSGPSFAQDPLPPVSQVSQPLPAAGPIAVPVAETTALAPQDESRVGERCRFSGRVVDRQGHPVARAVVMHLPDERTLQAMGIVFGLNEFQFSSEQQARFAHTVSDDEGRFELESRFVPAFDPHAHTWVWTEDPSLVVSHPGHAMRAHLCAGFAGGDYDAGDIAIEPGCRFVGRVVDERGEPIAGARIRANQDGLIRPVSATTADDRGSARLAGELLATSSDMSGGFAIEGLWNGSVQVWVWAPQHVPANLGARPLVAGETSDAGDVTLADGERISGRVEDQHARPVIGAQVFAHHLSPEERMQLDDGEADAAALGLGCVRRNGQAGARTDSAGRFELCGLERRPVQVLVDADGFDIAAIPEVVPGEDSLIVRVTPEARCDVAVVDSQTGRPLKDATVVASRCALFGAPVELRVEPIAGRDGAFSVHQVWANSTAIRVSAPGRAAMLLWLKAAAPGIAESRTVPLGPAARLSGRVVEANGGSARAVQVAMWPLGESDQDIAPIPPEAVMTDAEGRFAFEGLAEGRWRIILRTARYERPRQDPECEAQVGRTDTVPDIILSRGGVLAGTLRDERGQPLAGYELFAVPKARAADATMTAERRRSRTDPAGRFEFAALQPFDWVIMGSSKGGAPLGEAHVGWHDRVDLELVEPAGALPAR